MRKKLTPDEKRELALAYLLEKYEEEFVPVSISESGWGQGHDEIYLYPKNGNKEKDIFAVWGTLRDDNRYVMHDGYFGVIIKERYEAVMSSFVKEIYKEFKLYTNPDSGIVYQDRLNKDTKISDIYDIDENFASFTTIFVKQSSALGIDTLVNLKKIAQKMKEKKLVGKVIIHIVFNDKYEIVDYDTLDKEKKEYFVQGSRKYIWVNPNLEIEEGE